VAPTAVRLLLIEGENADGATVEQDNIEVVAGERLASQLVAAIVGTREAAFEAGHRLTSTGVTWTDPADPAEIGALRDELAARGLADVMLVSPLLAAAALAQTVGSAIGYQRVAMLFIEQNNATLAVVEVADGSIAELHRQRLQPGLSASRRAAHLATMVAGLDARGPQPDGIFLIGCGADIVSIKPALEAVTSLQVSAPEEPDMALARGTALASADAPLFASSTAALAYALDPATGELSTGSFAATDLAYSAVKDEVDVDHGAPRRMSVLVAASALAAILAVVAGVLLVLTADRPSAARQYPRARVANPAQVPSQPPQAQLPPPSSPPPPPAPAPGPTAAAAPPPPAYTPPPAYAPHTPPPAHTPYTPPPAYTPPPVHHAPTPRAPAPVPTPVPQAAPAPTPVAPPPAAPPPQPAPAAVPARPPMTMYLHFPFVTVPIPITPPPPPPPPQPPAP
jgi:hypothetical protein